MKTSSTGQLRQTLSEQFELMIQGRTRDDLENFRKELLDRGLTPSEIHVKASMGILFSRSKTLTDMGSQFTTAIVS